MEDILVQLQQQKQRQNQNQAQSQAQSDRTKFGNNGNPKITIKNEANALSVAVIVILVRLFSGHSGKLNVDKKSVEEFVAVLLSKVVDQGLTGPLFMIYHTICDRC